MAALIDINAGVYEGHIFNGWVCENPDVVITDSNSPVTTLEMIDTDVIITATWRVIPELTGIQISPRPLSDVVHPKDEYLFESEVARFKLKAVPEDAVLPDDIINGTTWTSSDPNIMRMQKRDGNLCFGHLQQVEGTCTVTATAANGWTDSITFTVNADCVVYVIGSNALENGSGVYKCLGWNPTNPMAKVQIHAGSSPEEGVTFSHWEVIQGNQNLISNSGKTDPDVSFYPVDSYVEVKAIWNLPLQGLKFKDNTPTTQEFGSYQTYTVETIPEQSVLPELTFSTSNGVLIQEPNGPEPEGGLTNGSVYLFADKENGTEVITVTGGGFSAQTTVSTVAASQNPVDFVITPYNRSLIGYTGEANENLVIPESFTKGIQYNVVGLGGNAFWKCANLASVTIPNSIKSMLTRDFGSCTGLTSITIPESITRIPSYTFYQCSGLTEVNLPNTITEIGDLAFGDCTGLTTFTVPEGVTKIGGSAFEGCNGLTEIYIPSTVTEIGVYAFSDCTSLRTINIDKPVDSIPGKTWTGASIDPNITINWNTPAPPPQLMGISLDPSEIIDAVPGNAYPVTISPIPANAKFPEDASISILFTDHSMGYFSIDQGSDPTKLYMTIWIGQTPNSTEGFGFVSVNESIMTKLKLTIK